MDQSNLHSLSSSHHHTPLLSPSSSTTPSPSKAHGGNDRLESILKDTNITLLHSPFSNMDRAQTPGAPRWPCRLRLHGKLCDVVVHSGVLWSLGQPRARCLLVRESRHPCSDLWRYGMGSTVETLCGQADEVKRYNILGIYMQRSTILLIATAIPLTLMYIFSKPLLILLGESSEIASAASTFVYGLIPQIFACVLNFPIQKFLQSQSIVLPSACISGGTAVVQMLFSWIAGFKLGLGLLLCFASHGGWLWGQILCISSVAQGVRKHGQDSSSVILGLAGVL